VNSKDEYYLKITLAVGEKSTCKRRKMGAIIVVNDAIVSTGYNGPARGSINCDEVECLKNLKNAPQYSAYDLCPAVHAEENAVVNAARNGTKVFGGTLYVVGRRPSGEIAPSHPCERCARIIINAGIKRVVTMDEEGKVLEIPVEELVRKDKEKYLEKLKAENGRKTD